MTRIAVAVAAAAVISLPVSAQPGKKVFISADMEGISGISSSDQLSAAGAEYGRSRKMMADDVNAAVRGARAGGASTIVVAPPALAPRIAALTSSAIIFRERPYSAPVAES